MQRWAAKLLYRHRTVIAQRCGGTSQKRRWRCNTTSYTVYKETFSPIREGASIWNFVMESMRFFRKFFQEIIDCFSPTYFSGWCRQTGSTAAVMETVVVVMHESRSTWCFFHQSVFNFFSCRLIFNFCLAIFVSTTVLFYFYIFGFLFCFWERASRKNTHRPLQRLSND